MMTADLDRRMAVADALRRVADDITSGAPDLDEHLVHVADDALALAVHEAPTLARAEHIAGIHAAVGTLGTGLPVELAAPIMARFTTVYRETISD